MKSQITSLILLLLLVAVLNQAEAKTVKYRRTFKGKVESGGDPAAKIRGTVSCDAIAEYLEGIDSYPENELKKSGSFRTNTKGEFSVRLVFEDKNVDAAWKQRGFGGDCIATINGNDVGLLAFSGKFDPFSFGTIELEQ